MEAAGVGGIRGGRQQEQEAAVAGGSRSGRQQGMKAAESGKQWTEGGCGERKAVGSRRQR